MLGFVMGERLIAGACTPEKAWQAWAGLHLLPRTQLRELVPHGVRTVVVSPHPDDEILATGGLLAMLAREGAEVCVVAVTEGGGSHAGSARWPEPLLVSQRRAESLEGLARLGLAPHTREALEVPDGQVRAHMHTLVCWLRQFLRPDDVVLSTWALDGHPDHEASAQATAMACSNVGARHVEVPVWMWHWASPNDTRVHWQRMVRLPLSADAMNRKQLALSAHSTQLEPQDTGRPPVLAPATTARLLRPFEFFILPA